MKNFEGKMERKIYVFSGDLNWRTEDADLIWRGRLFHSVGD